MGLIVQKFGGTSLGTPDRIRAVADRVAATVREGNSVAVVVSAMGSTTDDLLTLAHQVAENPPHREIDMLLTAGERISMALLSMALAERKVGAISFTGSQTGIITDPSHRRARIVRILGDRVRSAIADRKVAIIAGFQGVSESKEITTLGRGGSDTTAVALALALKAERCDIFTDVDGVFSADPRVVKEARLHSRIPHDLMVELAVRGAGVLHPRSVQLAKQYGVRLCVRNSLREISDPNEGTEVVSNDQTRGIEEFNVVGVTADSDKGLMTIELMRPTVLGAVWDAAAQSHLNIITPLFSGSKVQFFTDVEFEGEWKKHLQRLTVEGFVKSFDFDLGVVPLSVVGHRFTQDGAALLEIMETLAHSGISVTMGAASSLAITLAVPSTHVEDGVRALHQKYLGENH